MHRRGHRPRRPDGMAAPGRVGRLQTARGGFGPPSPAATSAPAGHPAGMHPRFLSDLRKRRRAVPDPKKRPLGRAPCSDPPRATGSAYRCLLRFGLAFGHAMLFCDSCCCRPVADGADLVGVVVAWSCYFSLPLTLTRRIRQRVAQRNARKRADQMRPCTR